ncbi:MAG: hypothetical protein ACTSU5_05960, partial [Promethearchaeota archaeon]
SFIIGGGYLLTLIGVVLHLLRGLFIQFAYSYFIFLSINVVGVLVLVYGYSAIPKPIQQD